MISRVLESVVTSEWINPVSKLDKYLIPKVEDLFVKLQNGTTFTKLDLIQAYQQLILDDESRKFVVINIQKGLFCYTRLPYGILSSPGICQRIMNNLLLGIQWVVTYLDDILITGATEEEHLQTLEEVLEQLSKAGLSVNKHKCSFMVPRVSYHEQSIDANGIHPLSDKVKAVEDAPTPKNIMCYLGLLTSWQVFTHLSYDPSTCIRVTRRTFTEGSISDFEKVT